MTNLALLPAEVLQKAKQNQRQRGQKAENIDKPCPVLPAEVLQMREIRILNRRDRKQTILTSLALLSADERKQTSI